MVKREHNLNIRFNAADYARLEAVSRRLDQTYSETVRELIAQADAAITGGWFRPIGADWIARITGAECDE